MKRIIVPNERKYKLTLLRIFFFLKKNGETIFRNPPWKKNCTKFIHIDVDQLNLTTQKDRVSDFEKIKKKDIFDMVNDIKCVRHDNRLQIKLKRDSRKKFIIG